MLSLKRIKSIDVIFHQCATTTTTTVTTVTTTTTTINVTNATTSTAVNAARWYFFLTIRKPKCMYSLFAHEIHFSTDVISLNCHDN